jgi:hypothetical protein
MPVALQASEGQRSELMSKSQRGVGRHYPGGLRGILGAFMLGQDAGGSRLPGQDPLGYIYSKCTECESPSESPRDGHELPRHKHGRRRVARVEIGYAEYRRLRNRPAPRRRWFLWKGRT